MWTSNSWRGIFLVGLLWHGGPSSPGVQPQELSSELVTRAPTKYKIEMTTKVIIPERPRRTDRLRIWHALPTRRPWSDTKRGHGATNVKSSRGGREQSDKANHSHHVLWDLNRRLKPRTELSFTSKFTVRSVEREFMPKESKAQWEHYTKSPPDWTPEMAAIHPDLVVVANKIRRTASPAEAVHGFSRWIYKSISYDASVPFATDEIGKIIKAGRGHCGHQSAIMEQLCRNVGVPYRSVSGLNLYEPDGIGKLDAVRADYTNIHTWGEVFFPDAGWIEVEPGGGEQAFKIPARLIQNNRWFQNYAIWIKVDGQDRTPTWSFIQGKYISEYGVENRICYSQR